MAYTRKDHYYRRAKREGKASRAAYKIAELRRRFHLVERGDIVLDLGCAPGGWMQELAPFVGPAGKVVGIDILPLKIGLPRNSVFIQGNLEDESSQKRIAEEVGTKANAIFSDMSPNLSGITFTDAYRSHELAVLAFDICGRFLKPGGNFVVKFFPGPESRELLAMFRELFSRVETVVPKATRKTSSERYIIAMGFKVRQKNPRSL